MLISILCEKQVLQYFREEVGIILINMKRNAQYTLNRWDRRVRDRIVVDNYICNQCLSPLMLWVRISIRARCTHYVIKFVS